MMEAIKMVEKKDNYAVFVQDCQCVQKDGWVTRSHME
jgi:hypothetical protein